MIKRLKSSCRRFIRIEIAGSINRLESNLGMFVGYSLPESFEASV